MCECVSGLCLNLCEKSDSNRNRQKLERHRRIMKGSAHPGDKNFHKAKRSLQEGGFQEFFYARPWRVNAMILLKFEHNL